MTWFICLVSFLFLSGFLFFSHYHIPGLISFSGLVSSLVNSSLIFFALGSKFSVVGSVSLIISCFYGFFLSIYFLDFLRKMCKIVFLDKNSILLAFRKGFLFAVDLSFPLFIFSSLVSFLAPPYLREFGIFLSIFIIVMFLVFSFVNFLIVNFVKNNFTSIKEFYKNSSFKRNFFLVFFSFFSGRNRNVFLITLASIYLAGMVFFWLLGFNSFSLFRENFLVTLSLEKSDLAKGKNRETVDKVLNLETISGLVGSEMMSFSNNGSRSFLIKDPSNFKNLLGSLRRNLSAGGYSIQSTSSFNGVQIFRDSLWVFLFSSSLISMYVFMRFGFFNLINLILNSSFMICIFFSFLALTQIFVNHDIFVIFLALFAFVLMVNIFWFNALNFKFTGEVFINSSFVKSIRNKILNIKSRELYLILFFIFLSFFSFLWSTNEDLIVINFYISLAFVFVYFLAQYLILIIWEKLYFLKSSALQNIFKSKNFSDKFNVFKDYVELEEEQIENINTNF